jgi:hypothetical protein
MLPAFQLQTLNWLPVDRHFLAVIDFIRKTARGVKAVMALRNLSLGRTIINCLAGRSFATECFCV